MKLRRVLPDDRAGLAALAAAHDLEIGPPPGPGAELEQFVAEEDGALVARGFFRRLYGPVAELGIVAGGTSAGDAATLLVRHLAAEAQARRISRLVTRLEADDDAALAVLRAAGRTREVVDVDHGTVDVDLLA